MMDCHSKHYHCVSTEWWYTWSLSQHGEWIAVLRSLISDIVQIYSLCPYANHYAQVCYSYTRDQPTGISLQDGRHFCVYSHQQTKPQSSQGTQTFVDWNSNLLLAEAVSKPSGFWITSASDSQAALCSWALHVSSHNWYRFSPETRSASEPISIWLPCCPLLNAKQTDTLILSTLEKHHVLSQIHHVCGVPGLSEPTDL